MQVNKINSQQPSFNGSVGQSMKKYVSYQMERELTDLYARDAKFGPFANVPILADRVKTLHAQVQSKLSNFMEKLNPNISMEYEAGVVKLQNKDSQKTLSCVVKDSRKRITGDVYGDKIDVFSPFHVDDSGEKTLLYIDSFASVLDTRVSDKIESINKALTR